MHLRMALYASSGRYMRLRLAMHLHMSGGYTCALEPPADGLRHVTAVVPATFLAGCRHAAGGERHHLCQPGGHVGARYGIVSQAFSMNVPYSSTVPIGSSVSQDGNALVIFII